jgi:hypothetical protein
VLLIGERSLRLALSEYVGHYHADRNHQGKDNVLLFPRDTQTRRGVSPKAGRAVALLSSRSRVTLAEKSWMILWLEVGCTCARPTMLLANAQVSPNIACAVDQ